MQQQKSRFTTKVIGDPAGVRIRTGGNELRASVGRLLTSAAMGGQQSRDALGFLQNKKRPASLNGAGRFW